MGRTTLINGRVITPNLEIAPGRVVIADGRIESVGPEEGEAEGNVVDCSGLWVLPGLVDIHCHGGAGGDFLDEEDEPVDNAFLFHLSQGVTSIAPTGRQSRSW
jgi:N-acetylglucosamine-6-phosphate deacetylase